MSVNPVVDTDIFNSMFRKQMKMDSFAETLAGTKTVAKEYPPVLLFDPGGAGRTVLLPAEGDSEGLVFWIFNTADAAEILTVKEDSDTTTIVALDQNEFGFVYCDGTTWRGFSSFTADITASAAEINYLDIAVLGTGAASKAVVLDTGDDYTWPATGVLTHGKLNDATTELAATHLELNRIADVSGRLVAGGATLTLTQALHDGKTVLWDTAAGTILTLPAATGSGMKIRCAVSVTATSNDHSIACVGTDDMLGTLMSVDIDTSDATLAWAAQIADTFDTITFNRTTTGLAALGDWVELEDVASGVWAVRGGFQASGSVATPFTSAVS